MTDTQGASAEETERAGRPAEGCRTMDDVRAEIDRIDEALVALIAERTQYIEAAARIKDSADHVRVEWRVNEVLAKVDAKARAVGAPSAIVEAAWRALVEQSIQHEARVWRALRGLDVAEGD